MTVPDLAVSVAAVGNGLLAGLYLAFACAVTPALRRLGDRPFVDTFRAVNDAILNPCFLACFIGAPLASVVAVSARGTLLVLVGAAAAVVSLGVTVLVSVPLNRQLALAATRTPGDYAAARGAFAGRWSRWNLVRTVLSAAALVALVGA